MILTELYEFIMFYSYNLQIVHEWILKVILSIFRIGSITDVPTIEIINFIHILFLFFLYFYLIYALWDKQGRSDTLSLLRWVGMLISVGDWISMDIMTVFAKDHQYAWFKTGGIFLFVLHSMSFLALCYRYISARSSYKQETLVRFANEKADHVILTHAEAEDPWAYSYAVFTVVFLLGLISDTVNFAWTQISETFPEPELPADSLVWYRITGFLLTSYVVAVFYIIFPRITDKKDRKFSWFSFVFMGCVMGICDALVMTFAYKISLRVFSSFIWIYISALLVYLVPTAYYYAAIFNPKLAPVHRIPEYDLTKILLLTLSDILVVLFLVYWKAFFLVFVLQMLVLAGIVSSMRFPDPWASSKSARI